MIKKWFQIITDHRISLHERMFRIVTGICMIAIAFTLPMDRSVWNIIMMVVSLAAMALIVRISIRKKCVHAGATAIAVLLLTLFPVTFFSAGGFYSGVPEWFVLCFIYVCITLQGRRRNIFFGLCTAETLLCYSTAFYFPEIAAPGTQNTALFDSAFSMIMVGLLTSVLLMFLNRMYEEENALTQQQKKEIEELNQAENHFFSSMSHEIRTPINSIIGLNEIILRGDISDEVAENARNIQGASKMLLSLINDILDLSRLEANRVTLTWEECDVVQLCNQVVASVSFSRRSDNQFLFNTSFESFRMETDVQRMQQVIINLMSNADKFTKQGKITLDFSVNEETQMAVFSVTDTGCGIPKEKQALVFERFEKLNEYAQGTGLGLSICKLIVYKWKGEIWIDPDYTGGARFVFSHPLNIEKE